MTLLRPRVKADEPDSSWKATILEDFSSHRIQDYEV